MSKDVKIDPIVDELELKLIKPVTFVDDTYTSLHLREPTAKELADSQKAGNDIDMAIALISMVANVPKTAVGMLCQRDLAAAGNFFSRFS